MNSKIYAVVLFVVVLVMFIWVASKMMMQSEATRVIPGRSIVSPIEQPTRNMTPLKNFPVGKGQDKG